MNIIVSQDKTIRLTQYSSQSSYDLDKINVYIARTLPIKDYALLQLVAGRNKYPFYLEQIDEIVNYYVYKVLFISQVSLSAGAYATYLIIDDNELFINDITFNTMQYQAAPLMLRSYAMRAIPAEISDEHLPIEIMDRDIKLPAANQVAIVAEDNVSQCLTFRMPKTYDGVDLTAKSIYVDFIDSATKELRNALIDPMDISIDNTDNTLINVKWLVPYAATKKAGTLAFALSAVGNLENNDYYIWQTKPSKLTIYPNLAKRNETPSNAEDELNVLAALQAHLDEVAQNVENLSTDVEEIKTSDIYSLDAETPDDQEVILRGGAAPID